MCIEGVDLDYDNYFEKTLQQEGILNGLLVCQLDPKNVSGSRWPFFSCK